MASVTVKNIPLELLVHLKQAAESSRRSLNSEMIVCLERALGRRTLTEEAILSRARRWRARTSRCRVTTKEVTAAKRSGRP
jgi:antitoxin FitA